MQGRERAGEVGIERLGLRICRAYSLQETTRGWERAGEVGIEGLGLCICRAGRGRERLELRGWGCAYAGLGEGERGWKRVGEVGRMIDSRYAEHMLCLRYTFINTINSDATDAKLQLKFSIC
jgi:hypothetical protein